MPINWAAIGATAAKVGGTILGLLGSKSSAESINEGYQYDQWNYQSNLQWQQQQWLERMSNTAHQREMADLRAAGLNPLLTANNGAATPSSGMGSVGLPSADATVTERQNKIANAIQLGQLSINAQNANSQQILQNSQANLNDAQSQTEQTKQLLNLAERIYKLDLSEGVRNENSVFEQKFNIWKQHMTAEILQGLTASAKMQNEINISNQQLKLDNMKTSILSSATEHENLLKDQKKKESEEIEKYYREKSRGYTLTSPETWSELGKNLGNYLRGAKTKNWLRRDD